MDGTGDVPDYVRAMGGKVPPLVGEKFLAKWGGESTRGLLSRLQVVTKLEDAAYLNLLAYILQFNGARAGDVALTTNTNAEIRSVASGRGK